jgi:DNA-binding MarR family transcriptional regulator
MRYLGLVSPIEDDALAGWRALLNAHAFVTRAISRELAAADLPDLRWYDLLWTLYRAPERRLRVTDLAREGVLTQTATSRFVDRVAAAGCVRKEVDATDRRAFQVVLTEAGVDLLRRMWPIYERGIERHFAAHGGAKLRRSLEAMADSAREAGA